MQWDDALAQGKLKQPPAAPPASPSAREQPSIRSIMQFDGPAPELINGRAAMLGFAAAVLGELHTGESVLNLLNDVPQGVLVVFTLILVGSLFPMGLAVHPHHKAHGFFTASNEIWGGRFACAPARACRMLCVQRTRQLSVWDGCQHCSLSSAQAIWPVCQVAPC